MAWRTTTSQIPYGNKGNTRTLRAMHELALRASHDPRLIEAAHDAVRWTPERDDRKTFSAVLTDVRRRMRYTHDPLGAELVKDPVYVVGMSDVIDGRREPMDCDDASTLTAAMLGALGYQTRFVTVAVDPRRPNEWSHVYVAAKASDGQWVALDPIVREFGVGDEVPAAQLTAPRAYHEGVDPMSRLGCAGCSGRSCAGCSMGGLGEASWWETALSTASNAYAKGQEAKITSAQERTKQLQLQRDIAMKRGAGGGGGFSVTEFFNPITPSGFSAKGLIGWGVLAAAGFALLKRRR